MLLTLLIAPDPADRALGPSLSAQVAAHKLAARAANHQFQHVAAKAPFNPQTNPLSLNDARTILEIWTSSSNKLDTLLYWYGGMRQDDWLTLLGEVWTALDYVYEYRALLRRVVPQSGPLRCFMTKEENAAYDALPNKITCYRGAATHRISGAICWSLSRDVANAFPFQNRYLSAEPVLATGTVLKRNVLAVKLDRNEQEIISFKVRRTSLEPASYISAQIHWAACPTFTSTIAELSSTIEAYSNQSNTTTGVQLVGNLLNVASQVTSDCLSQSTPAEASQLADLEDAIDAIEVPAFA